MFLYFGKNLLELNLEAPDVKTINFLPFNGFLFPGRLTMNLFVRNFGAS